jgi:exosome complex exonuclease RRP6
VEPTLSQPETPSTSTSNSTYDAVSPPPQLPQAKKQKKKKVASSSEALPPPIVPHDYTGSTSILDAGPAVLTGMERREAEKKQKKKDKAAQGGSGKKMTIDTSEFKRPMRVNNAPKSASVSRTFQN